MRFIRLIFLSLFLTNLHLNSAALAEKPNLLFLFADDMCYEALGAVGGEVETPHLDRLVERGVTFSNAYNQGAWNGAVCMASRAMFATGQFLWRTHRLDETMDQEAAAGRLWSQRLAAAGYDTYMAGKWHIHTDPAGVFHTVGTIRAGMPEDVKAGYNRPKSPEDYATGWKPWDRAHGGYWEGGKHWSEVLGDEGTGFLQQAAESDAPFFMYLAFNAPHDPRQSPKEYVDKYPLDRIRVPENFLPEYPYKDEIGCSARLRDARLAPFPRTEYSVKVNRQEYYALITHMDDQIGRLLAALEATGKADSTYILFTADHGLAVGHHGLIGKQNMYEHSVRAPLILTGPGIPAGEKRDAPVYIQDLVPTTLDLAGAETPASMQFKSLLPLIRNEVTQTHEAIYGGYLKLQRMVRKGDYKAIHYPTIAKTRLYNLNEDPQEMHDLAEDPANKPILSELAEAFRDLQEQTGDSLEVQF
ncbi:Arylsulfatase [Planctomycetes bacterium MalM25]|nr:Arylsulfatase [Planctomycetes bacterium MalM25]